MSDRPVVVGTDGTPAGNAAVDWAVDEAARRRVPLRIVHAAVWAHYAGGRGSLADVVTRDAGARARTRRPSVAVAAEVVLRDPVPALLTEGDAAVLLVLGSRALGRFAGALLGSVSLPVVVALPCPVVVVRDLPAPPEPHDPVVLGVGEHGSAAAVTVFALEAARGQGCPLRAVHAWRVPRVEGATAHTGQYDDARNSCRSAAQHRLDDALSTVRGPILTGGVRRVLGEGPPSEVLLGACEEASLLVVGARRRDTRVGHRIGSVNRAVLRHAPCPVAVVPHL